MSPNPASAPVIPHVAEDILPGHPDRLADAIAERIVQDTVLRDPEALVGVEVAVFRGTVLVTGRVAAGNPDDCLSLFSEAQAYQAFEDAGYRGRWAITPNGFAGPDAEEDSCCQLRVLAELDLGPLSCEEASIRGFSDDQNIVVGHASGSEATGWMPPAAFAARKLREALSRVREANSDLLGPDGKVLVRILEQRGGFRLDILNVALQHAPDIGYEALHRVVLPVLETEVKALDAALPGLSASWAPDRVRLNGGGDFSCGGPHGDNGLSGKKLVVDHYGPGVPIGGGALCGKDAHKVDRAGALRARQIAVRIVRDAGSREATVRLGFLPGLCEPAFLDANVDGQWYDAVEIAKLIPLPDLSVLATVCDFELLESSWPQVARAGYFGRGWSWER